jgi:acyl-CoA dehydrogenase
LTNTFGSPDAAHRHQVGRDQLKAAQKGDTLVKQYEAYRERSRELKKLWKLEGLEHEFEWEYIPPTSGSKL